MADHPDRLSALLRRIVVVPTMRDPADAIAASLVARAIDVLMVGVLLFIVLGALAGRLIAIYAVTLPAGLLLLLAVRWILGRGQVRTAAYALCGLGWVINATDLLVHGPQTVAIGGFMALIVVGAATLGLRGAVAIALASTALLAPVMLGAVHGNFEAPTGRDLLLHYTTQLLVTAALAGWWATRTRRLMRDLRRSEVARALLLESSPDAIVSSDALGVMTYQNPATERMMGYPASEVLGRPWPELPMMRDTDVSGLMARFSATVRDGGYPPPRELTLVHRDGRRVVVDAKSMPLYEDGKIVGTVSILRDITERKAAEADRISLQRQLTSAQRMEAVARVAGGVAHDFNNLLTIILAAASTGDAAAMDDVRDAAHRGVVLTRQLLAFSGRKPADPRPIDVNRAIMAIAPMLGRLLGADVKLALQPSRDSAATVIDAGQLDQVLVNLAANARDAMPGGGTLTIATAATDDRVMLRVNDTGTGMDAATLASAFEPFFTTKGSRGTGLGLAVVQNVVREAGGTVACESELGRGTAFVLTFPASAAPLEGPPVEPDGAPMPFRRIVYVDDNTMLRSFVTRLLQHSGLVVDEFDGAQDVSAIEKLLAHADALVTDLVMPGRSGVDLALELRRRGCQKPVLFLSGYAEHALLERLREVPRSSFLEKPFVVKDVIDRLTALLAS